MSQICKTLEGLGFELQLTNRDGFDCVEARRTPQTSIAGPGASRLLLELARKQDEAVAYLKPAGSNHISPKPTQIEATLKRGVSEREEAKLIYEYNALLFGPTAKSSDGYTWESLVRMVK